MAKRVQIAEEPPSDGGSFFPPTSAVVTFPSGSTLLDLVNGGGWAVGRVVHIIGNSSTGKTQLATEAMVNFDAKFPNSPIEYIDSEHAYDASYAEILGLPRRVKPNQELRTIESYIDHVIQFAEAIPDGGQGLHILDSFDSISDEAEQERKITDPTYGGDKPKMFSTFCRKHSGLLAAKGVTLLIISQVRDNLNAGPFGPKERVAGGRALKFYASQQVWLHHQKRMSRTVRGVEREVGVLVRAKNEKNKVSVPFRDCHFPIMFNFGVDDVQSMASWLIETGNWSVIGTKKEAESLVRESMKLSGEDWQAWRKNLRGPVRKLWREIEADLCPNKRKYAGSAE